MTRRALLMLALAGCPKGKGHEPSIERPGTSDARPSRLLPAPDDGQTDVILPPAPPLPVPPEGLPPLPPMSATVTPEAVALGELLFFEPRLASDRKTSCASCHDPAHDYAGAVDHTAAGQPNLRRTPALVNLAWNGALGWDGRYASLDELLPIHVRGQLGGDLDLHAIEDVPTYRAQFARVGGAPQDAALHALEAYVLTRYDGGAPWDRLEPTARRPTPGAAIDPIVAGYLVFTGKAQCAVCHPPPLYTDLAYHAIDSELPLDEGRGKVDPARRAAFRTPTLRGVASRVAYFHNGNLTTLDQAIDRHLPWLPYIPSGGPQTFDPRLVDPALAKIRLSPDDRTKLMAFLRALTSTSPAPARPVLP